MPARTIFIAGVPASGKSTLFKRIREELFNDSSAFKHGSCRGIESKDGRYKMLGVFDGSMFEGTDRLSMTVIGDSIEYIKTLQNDETRYVVFVEGDRLFNYRFLSETRAKLFLIDANEKVLKYRHNKRGDSQTEKFIRSRRTKVENFVSKYNVKRIWNNTIEDQTRIFEYLMSISKDYLKSNEEVF